MSTHSKSAFQVKDPAPAQFGAEEPRETKYMGPERRRNNRRSGHDRRLDVRFELNTEDRRQSRGRRHDERCPAFW